jgi:hypothetical protein
MNPSEYRRWGSGPCTAEKGIVVGSDMTQEWLLPWWWGHYTAFHAYPVAFVDFGMSIEMKKWCEERGTLIPLLVADIFVTDKHEIDPLLAKQMEDAWGKTFWSCRNAWFKKPLACLQSPFLHSIWIDLDCEIRGTIDALFDLCREHLAIAIGSSHPVSYNSGVVAFKHGLSVIETWANQAFERNHLVPGDQDVLNAIIHEQNVRIVEIPAVYNWSRCSTPNPEARILHWHGPQGKSVISHQIMKKQLDTF